MMHTQIFPTNLGLATISDVILLQIGVGRRIECDQYVLVIRLDDRRGRDVPGLFERHPWGRGAGGRFSHLFRAATDAELLDMRAVQVRVSEYRWNNRRRD